MSGDRLLFTFQNGTTFAMDRRHMVEGARIHFNFDLLQVESIYHGSLLYLVNQDEVKIQTPLVEFRLRQPEQYDFEISDSSDEHEFMTTSVQEIAEASASGVKNMVTGLTRAQRRNRNKRLKRQKQLRGRQDMEDISQSKSQTIDVPFKEIHATSEMPDSDIMKRKQKEKVASTSPAHMNTQNLKLEKKFDRKDSSEEELRRIRAIEWKTFEQYKHINKGTINILEGLKLFTRIFDNDEQAAIIDHIIAARDQGRAGRLKRKTYSEPNKWIRGKGRQTIQYGCCYNYARDREGNLPGILRHEQVDPLPTVIIQVIRRLVIWGVIPADCVPDSCIINIYDEGDCIPPHIDSHDFERPFCTISLMNRCSIVFGREIQIIGPGEFEGTYRILLTRGSVLLFQGNGADFIKHCIPSVNRPRISITLRRMKPEKRPVGYEAIPELEELKPLKLP